MARFTKLFIATFATVLVGSINSSSLSFADDLPPSLPRPEGIGIIGTIDGNPIYGPIGGGSNSSSGNSGSGNSITWFPGMRDSSGTVIPPPLYNQDGTLYVEGVSSRPRIPVYKGSSLERRLSEPGIITDKSILAKINTEIKSTDIELTKSADAYILNFEQNISALDSALYLSAINKKSKKTAKIEIKIDNNGQAVAPTKIDLSKYNVFLKRGKTTLKKISVNN
jgi:hypothetical protein